MSSLCFLVVSHNSELVSKIITPIGYFIIWLTYLVLYLILDCVSIIIPSIVKRYNLSPCLNVYLINCNLLFFIVYLLTFAFLLLFLRCAHLYFIQSNVTFTFFFNTILIESQTYVFFIFYL